MGRGVPAAFDFAEKRQRNISHLSESDLSHTVCLAAQLDRCADVLDLVHGSLPVPDAARRLVAAQRGNVCGFCERPRSLPGRNCVCLAKHRQYPPCRENSVKMDELFRGELVEGTPSAAEAMGTKAPGPTRTTTIGDPPDPYQELPRAHADRAPAAGPAGTRRGRALRLPDRHRQPACRGHHTGRLAPEKHLTTMYREWRRHDTGERPTDVITRRVLPAEVLTAHLAESGFELLEQFPDRPPQYGQPYLGAGSLHRRPLPRLTRPARRWPISSSCSIPRAVSRWSGQGASARRITTVFGNHTKTPQTIHLRGALPISNGPQFTVRAQIS